MNFVNIKLHFSTLTKRKYTNSNELVGPQYHTIFQITTCILDERNKTEHYY